MPVLTQLNLNIGTEQNPNMVLHDLHDIRISSTDVTTVTRLLGCDAGVNSIAPITLANAASLLGVDTIAVNILKVLLFRGMTNNSDCDSFTTGIYFAFGNCQNRPENVSCIILSFIENPIATANGDKFQIALTTTNNLYIRTRVTGGNWKTWKSL